MYSQTGLSTNEFLGNAWNRVSIWFWVSEGWVLVYMQLFSSLQNFMEKKFKPSRISNEIVWNQWQVLNGSNETLGVAALKLRGLHTESYWYWIGVIAMVAFFFFFNGISALALTYLDREHSHFKYKSIII